MSITVSVKQGQPTIMYYVSCWTVQILNVKQHQELYSLKAVVPESNISQFMLNNSFKQPSIFYE